MKLEEKLVSLRKKKGLTQMNVAEVLDVSRQAISRWESGNAIPSTENLKSLSKLYEVPVDYLLKEEREEYIFEEKTKAGQETRYWNSKRVTGAIAIFLVLLVVVLSLIYKMEINKGGEGEEIPIGKMESETWDNTWAEVFSMDW